MEVDYIIVGGGYAGLFFAHQLLKHDRSFILFSEGKGASLVSAGVVNPVVLKKFTTFWLAQEQIRCLTETLSEIGQYLSGHYLISENIYRIFHDQSEKELWLKKSHEEALSPFLETEYEKVEVVENPYGCGRVNNSARLDVTTFFTDFFSFLMTTGRLRQEKFVYGSLRENAYGTIRFKNIIFCEGVGVKENPFFCNIPIYPNKGHHLKVRLSVPLETAATLKKKHFLFPLGDGDCYYGGTYDPNDRSPGVEEAAVEQLTAGLTEFYKHPFEILSVDFGYRPTVKDRRPLLGSHPEYRNYFVFNGLGARGILNGCFFAKELFDHIENGKPLMPEVDLKRFTS